MRRSSMVTAAAAVALAAAVLPAATAAPAGAVAPADGTIFINEIHYDNTGTDAGEAIEIAGPAGTDLTGWSVVLYNGANGAVYNTQTISGTIADPAGGDYGTVVLSYPPETAIQNGAPDGVALVDADGTVVQFLSYENTFTAVEGPANGLGSTDIGVQEGSSTPVGHSLQLRGTGDTYGEFTWTAPAASTFGALNTGQTFGAGSGGGGTDPDACEITASHEIGAVQGEGDTSPLDGGQVTVEGVVVGDFQGGDQLRGVYLQDADGDDSAQTSDGIFVFDPDAPALAEGDVVRVTGTVDEFYGLTEITKVAAMADCGDAAVPAATLLDLPADDAELERLEGMLITLPEVTATETYNLARYGELVVSAGDRLYQPTNGDTADDAAEQAANDARRLIIDDASTAQNPDVVPFTDVNGEVIRLGDTLTDVEGILSYSFDAWRLQPTEEPTVQRTNARPESPDDVGGDVQVAAFNVLNYFTSIDESGAVTDGGHDPRGADSATEFERQQDKIVAAILELDAEIVGLMEIENDADDAAVENVVAALNEAADEERYVAIEEPDTGRGLFGTDAIKVAMIYQHDAVVPMGPAATTDSDAFDNARLPLAQRFRPADGGQPFTVVVNHFKSKGCGSGADAATGANGDQGDGQGCFNADRVDQAEALLGLVDSLNTKDVLVVGDLNAYGEEDPIDVLEAAGYVDLIDTRLPEDDQYTYVYDGQAGYLDHALVSPRLARRITGVDIWHINADEARFQDYNTEYNPERFYAPDAYRSSDHDPVLVGLAGQHGDRKNSRGASPDKAPDKAGGKAKGPKPVEVQLLALNDFHGALEEPGGSGGLIQTDAEGTTVPAGGAEFLATQLTQLAEEQKKNNTITVAAGDLIGASPLLSAAFHDEPAIESLGLAGLDYASVGNHEFDEGAEELLRIQNGGCHPVDGCADGTLYEGADFQYLSANAFVDETGEPLLAPYAIHKVQGVEIGFIGMTLEGTKDIVSQEGIAGISFEDEAETANRYAEELQAQGVEAIVVLLHEGGRQSGENAWQVNGCNEFGGPIVDITDRMSDAIDVVVTGHTHQAYNCTIDGKLVTSASSNGRLVTDIDLLIDRRTGDVIDKTADNTIVTRDVARDPAQTELIERYKTALGSVAEAVVGTTSEHVTKTQETLFGGVLGESALGNLIADAQLAATDDEYGAVAAFMNPGGVRADLDAGPVTYEEAFTVQPFANNLVTMDLTGEQLYCLLEQQFVVGRILYPSSTVSYVVDPRGTTGTSADPCAGTRVVDGSLTIGGTAVQLDQIYRVTVNSFLAGGGDGFSVLTGGTDRVTGPIDLDALTAYMGANSPMSAPALDRIRVPAEAAPAS